MLWYSIFFFKLNMLVKTVLFQTRSKWTCYCMENELGPAKSQWVNVVKFKIIFESWNPLSTNLNNNKPNQNSLNIFKHNLCDQTPVSGHENNLGLSSKFYVSFKDNILKVTSTLDNASTDFQMLWHLDCVLWMGQF